MSETAIEFINVSKRFPGNDYDSVSDVNLQIEKGMFVTILGASGSGKTTLLKTVNRIHELTGGTIQYFGKDINTLELNDYRRHIGYVVQQNGLFPHISVEDNIAVVPKMLKWDKEKTAARIKELMTLVRLDYEKYRKRFPRSLSGGEQQRVGLARALAVNPSVMLMDEPFGAIDAINRGVLQHEIMRIQKELNNTILFVTHDVNEAFLLGQKIIIMNGGKVQQFDTPYNIMMNPANDFVKNLIYSGDPYDKLKVLSVESAMTANEVTSDMENSIETDMYLNDALKQFLESGKQNMAVTRDGEVVGSLSLDTIKTIMRSEEE